MAKERTAKYQHDEFIGKALVVLGLVTLSANLTFLVQPVVSLIGKLQDGAMGVLPTLGGAILNATQAIAFHEINYISLISRILILFIALAAVVVGAARLHARRAQMMGREAEGLVDSMRGDW